MNQKTKQILDEMILFRNTWREQNFKSLVLLQPAIKELTAKTAYLCVGDVIMWPKELQLFDGFEEDDDYTDTYFEIDVGLAKRPQYNRLKAFFELCPEVKTFLKLEDDKVRFIVTLSNQEQKEIIKYVQDNYQTRMRWRSYPRKELKFKDEK